jgi:hypothetical protein
MRGFILAVAAVLGFVATPAAAQMTVSLYAGYVGSDGVYNASTDARADIKSSAAFAAALGTVLDASREVQLLYSQQSTTLSPGSGAAPFDLTVRYLHLGGTVFIDQPIARGWYVAGGLGATQFSPSTSGYGTEFRASMNLGFGYYWPLGENIALRAEARGFATFVNSEGGFLCSGGCVVVLKSGVFMQYAGLIGLTASF